MRWFKFSLLFFLIFDDILTLIFRRLSESLLIEIFCFRRNYFLYFHFRSFTIHYPRFSVSASEHLFIFDFICHIFELCDIFCAIFWFCHFLVISELCINHSLSDFYLYYFWSNLFCDYCDKCVPDCEISCASKSVFVKSYRWVEFVVPRIISRKYI